MTATTRPDAPVKDRSDLRLLYCSDIRFMPGPEREVYVEGQFPYAIWQRYLKAFQTINVMGRESPPAAGVSFEQLNRSSGPGVSFTPVPSLSSPRQLVRDYRTVVKILDRAVADCDAVIARLPSQIGLIAAGQAQRQGRPWAVEVVACPWDQLWNYGSWQGKAFASIQWARMRHAVAASPYTLYVSRSFLQHRYPTQGATTVVSNVEIPEPDPTVLDKRIDRIGTPRNRLVFGLIGSIRHRYKGIGTAIEALAQAQPRLPPYELRVLGQGDPKPWQELAHRWGIADRIVFGGTLPSGQPILDWLDAIDVYLQPSFQEGLPRALIEAMSRGCPAVASTAGGIPELLPAPCLHRPGDAARLASLVVGALDHDWQRREAARNFEEARQYVSTLLDERRTSFWQGFAERARAKRR